jgi:hypothetical protein
VEVPDIEKTFLKEQAFTCSQIERNMQAIQRGFSRDGRFLSIPSKSFPDSFVLLFRKIGAIEATNIKSFEDCVRMLTPS